MIKELAKAAGALLLILGIASGTASSEPHGAMLRGWIFSALVILVALLLLKYGMRAQR